MSKPSVISDPAPRDAVEALVAEVTAIRAQISGLQAREASLMASTLSAVQAAAAGAGARPGSVEAELPVRSLAAELGAALRVSDRSVQRQLGEAVRLTGEFPGTCRAWAEGRITRAHVTVILDAGFHLDDPQARAVYEAAVLPYAETSPPHD